MTPTEVRDIKVKYEPKDELKNKPAFQNNPKLLPSLHYRYTDEQIRDAIYACHGVRTYVCEVLDATVNQITSYCNKHPIAIQWFKDAREQIADQAELVLMDSLKSEDEKLRLDAAKFCLKSLGKTRGWSESPQINIAQQIVTDEATTIKNIFGINTDDDNGSSAAVSADVHNEQS